jgi:hypothetical protein
VKEEMGAFSIETRGGQQKDARRKARHAGLNLLNSDPSAGCAPKITARFDILPKDAAVLKAE